MSLDPKYRVIMARFLVDRLGVEKASQGLLCSPAALEAYIETGITRSNYIQRELVPYFFESLGSELESKSGVKNYDLEDLEDFKGGNRKGGAGGGSNNSFSTSVSDLYL